MLEGEVDLTCARIVQTLLLREAADLQHLHVDVSNLTFIDVAGMNALVGTARVLGWHSAELVLEGASETFRRIWSLLELDLVAGIRLEQTQVGAT